MSSHPGQYDLLSQPSEGKEAKISFSDQDSEDEPLIQSGQLVLAPATRCALLPVLCAIFATSTGVLLLLLLLLLVQTKGTNSQHGPPFANEFSESRPGVDRQTPVSKVPSYSPRVPVDPASIPLESVRFRGSPDFSLSGDMQQRPTEASAMWPEN